MNNFSRKLELLDGLETEFLRILYYDFDKYYKDTYKSYEYHRLCTIINGEKKVQVNNYNSLTYVKDEFIFLSPNSSVNLEINIPTKALVLELSDTLINRINDRVNIEVVNDLKPIKNLNFSHIKNNLDLNRSINKILSVTTSDDKNKEFLADIYAQELTYNLLKINSLQHLLKIDKRSSIQFSIDIMKNNILSKISIEEIASMVGMSLANFSAKFKRTTGISPNEYFTNLKLIESKKLLNQKNVTEVAYDLGYENISHFISLFKLKFGITPKQYIIKQNILI
ncbi:AraC family transcriptional regulator [Clostridium sp. SHJSY1]|uniref:helix-turn-helix domain-containing protein n=1 Tax=Clostridium sp. SHJSY1 TaxID=2942483 RepID=UPI0028755B2B|nr:AraC family transcriptional regulator [Clostridium sp. SHJSY1]MDS0528431.1 AraC family transcriptional regulator [Clostridium sp. SHJSY1]